MAANKATYDTAMKRAQQYAWANQWERAIKEYKRALTYAPNDPVAQRNMAQCFFRLKQWPQALEAYQALLATDPGDLFALNRLAEIYLALGHQDQALATYNHLADLYIEGKQGHEAVRALGDLSRVMPRNREVHDRLLLLAQEMDDKQAMLAEHLAISKIALDDGNLGEASAHAEAAESLEPENPEVRRWAYAVRKRIAETVGTGVIESDSRTQQALSTKLGTGLMGAKETDPPEAATLIVQASGAQERGEYGTALELYDRAIKAGARSAVTFYSAGLLNQQMARPVMAIPYLERAANDPEFATSAYYVLGLCYNTQRQYSRAVAAFERALALINPSQLTRNEADELIELYTAAAEANLSDNNPGRAGSLYANLVKVFKEQRWQHPRLPELEHKANELYSSSIQSKLEGIRLGSSILSDGRNERTSGSLGTSSMGTALMPEFSEGTSFMGTSSMGTSLMEGGQGGDSEQGTALISPTSEGTNMMSSSMLGSDALRELQELQAAAHAQGASEPLEATRLMVPGDAGEGEGAEEGTNLLRQGTRIIDDGEQNAVTGADIPTTLISRSGNNLRTITEYLRTADQGADGRRQKVAAGGQARESLGTSHEFATSSPITLPESDQLLLADAEEALHGERWEVAIDNCLSIIVSYPDYLPAHMTLGDVYLAQGKSEDAVTKYGTVMDTYVARGESLQAAETCRRLLELEPENPTLKTRLGLLLLEGGLVDEAARALLAIADDYYKAGNVNAAVVEAENLKLKLPTSPDVALALGTYKLALGDLAHLREAVAELGRALQLDTQNNTALARLYLGLSWRGDPTQWDALNSILQRAGVRSGEESGRLKIDSGRLADSPTTEANGDKPPADMSETQSENARLFLEEIYAGLQQKALPTIYYGLALVANGAGLANVAADALDDGLAQLSLAPTAELDQTWPLVEALMCQFRGDLALNEKDGNVAVQHYNRALRILDGYSAFAEDEGLRTADDDQQTNPDLQAPNSALESPRPQYAFLRVPVPVQLYFGLAEAQMLLEDWDAALDAFDGLKRLTPGDQTVYTRMADLHFRQGHLTRALGELNDLLVLYQKAGDHEKTLEALAYMSRLAPNNTAVRRKLSDMYLKLGMTDYGLEELATLADLQLKAGQLKEAMRTYQKSADLHFTLGQHDAALGIYERIVRLAPRDIDTRQQLINMFIQSGKLAEAVEAERALADLYIGDGQVEGAIAALHQLLALSPEDVPAHHSLAQQLVSIGEYGQAARLYGRLARLEPDNTRNPILQEEMQRMAREASSDVVDLDAEAPVREKVSAEARM